MPTPVRSRCRAADELPLAVRHFADLPDDALIDVRAVAILGGESVSTTWRRAARGQLKPIKTGPNTTRFRVGDVRRSLREVR